MAKNKRPPAGGMNYAQRLKASRDAAASFHRRFAIQFCMDGVAIGLNEHLGLEGKELADCMDTIGHWIMEIARLTVEDAADDKAIEYTKDQVDKRLQQILPEDKFSPWEDRMTEAVRG